MGGTFQPAAEQLHNIRSPCNKQNTRSPFTRSPKLSSNSTGDEEAVEGLNPRKAPGPDMVPSELFVGRDLDM